MMITPMKRILAVLQVPCVILLMLVGSIPEASAQSVDPIRIAIIDLPCALAESENGKVELARIDRLVSTEQKGSKRFG